MSATTSSSSLIAKASASSAMRRVASSDALKTQVVAHDFAVTAPPVTPIKLKRPVPTRARRDFESSPSPDRSGGYSSCDDKMSSSSSLSSSRKRTIMTAHELSPTSLKRRSSAEDLGFSVLLEGELNVVEQKQQNHASQDNPNSRTPLGTVQCRLTRQGRKCFVEFVDATSATGAVAVQTRRLPLARMSLFHDVQVPSHSFRLAGGDSSFSFTASSDSERSRWVQKLQDMAAKRSPSSSSSSSAFSAASATVRPAREEETTALFHPTTATTRPPPQLRSVATTATTGTTTTTVKRGGLVYTIPPKMTHIILVRHGHYINAHAKNVSDADQVLSQMGRQQAELTGKYLEQLYHKCPARHQQIALFHSDLTRAVETAGLVSKNIHSTSATPVASSLLREGWPGQPFASDQMPLHMKRQQDDADSDRKELDKLDKERMEQAYAQFLAEMSDEDECLFRVIVCHANLIRFFVCKALRIDPHGVWGHLEINHCGVTRIDLCRNRPLKVQAINETGHLPDSLTTSSEDHL